ncbi:MAG: hypothetical protein HC804_09190 [Anaerolineae bacterium]|nr:hypothetical protein [Anaerolineae bacterium]
MGAIKEYLLNFILEYMMFDKDFLNDIGQPNEIINEHDWMIQVGASQINSPFPGGCG